MAAKKKAPKIPLTKTEELQRKINDLEEQIDDYAQAIRDLFVLPKCPDCEKPMPVWDGEEYSIPKLGKHKASMHDGASDASSTQMVERHSSRQ